MTAMLNTYAANVLAQLHQTIDAGLEHMDDMRKLRELGEQMTSLEVECAWLDHDRRELLVEIGAEPEGAER